mgnify:CR=1 FL=1
MKTLLLSACCLVAVSSAFAAKLSWGGFEDELEFRKKLDETALDEKIKDQIYDAFVNYNIAESHLKEIMELNGLNKVKPKAQPINADVTDPTIKAILKQVQKTHNRFETLKRTINKWGPSTNLTARAAGASFQDKLNAARAYEKQVKAIQKAARKDGKNLGKLRKDLEKYRDKAETVDFRDLCQGLLDLLPVTNDED